MALENINSWGYTAKCEYASSLVKMFLERETKLDKNTEDHVYGAGLIRTLFTADYSMIVNESVRYSLTKALTPDPQSGASFDVLTRLRNLYMDIVTSLGYDFIEEYRINTLAALTTLGNSKASYAGSNSRLPTSQKALKKLYSEFLTNYPVILPCILGCKEYSLNLLQKRRMTQILDTGHTTP